MEKIILGEVLDLQKKHKNQRFENTRTKHIGKEKNFWQNVCVGTGYFPALTDFFTCYCLTIPSAYQKTSKKISCEF